MQTKKVTNILFVLYLLLLTWMIVYKLDLSILYGRYGFASVNLIPLAGTGVYDGVLDFPEILFNILSFIPFGIYMEMVFRKASWLNNLLVMALASLFFEGLQYLFLLGVADITDVLSNVFGGALGILLMYVATSIWREKTYTYMNVLCPLFTIGLLVITYWLV